MRKRVLVSIRKTGDGHSREIKKTSQLASFSFQRWISISFSISACNQLLDSHHTALTVFSPLLSAMLVATHSPFLPHSPFSDSAQSKILGPAPAPAPAPERLQLQPSQPVDNLILVPPQEKLLASQARILRISY